MSEENKMSVRGKDSGRVVCVCVGRGGFEEIFHNEEKNENIRKTCCIVDAVCCKC